MIRDPRGRSVDFGARPDRALATFIAVNARSEFRPTGLLLGLVGGVLGYLFQPSAVMTCIGAAVGLAVGFSIQGPRIGIIDRLDRQRRWVGLERVLSREQIAILEPAAVQWERIENAMQSDAWRSQPDWHPRVSQAAKNLMEQVILSLVRERSKSDFRVELKELAISVDRVTAAMGAYARPEFDSSGVPLGEGLPEVADLAERLLAVERG